jgi:hypothetical protein
MDWVQTIVSILSGLAVCIPLVVKLVEVVQKAIKEKNWCKLMKLVIDLMTEAEHKFSEGAAKKAWVMGEIEAAAKSIDYPYDEAAKESVSKMIDDICAASKELNVPKTTEQ